jgi:hypothetical protein
MRVGVGVALVVGAEVALVVGVGVALVVGVGVALVVGVALGRARARRGRARRAMSEGFIIILGLVFLLEVRGVLRSRL